jgi:hypothetical protein
MTNGWRVHISTSNRKATPPPPKRWEGIRRHDCDQFDDQCNQNETSEERQKANER